MAHRRSARVAAVKAGPDPLAVDTTDEDSIKPFRFVDLPAELRNRVYSYNFQHSIKSIQNLANFKEPPITMVSQQLRAESLPLLFYDNNWFLTIGSNPGFRGKKNRMAAGTLGVKRGVMKFLRESGSENAVLPNLTLYVYGIHDVQGVRQYLNGPDGGTYTRHRTLAKLELSVSPGGRLGCTAELTPQTATSSRRPFYTPMNLERVAILRKGLDAAKALAEKLSTQDDFKGFTIKDIDTLAKKFRFH